MQPSEYIAEQISHQGFTEFGVFCNLGYWTLISTTQNTKLFELFVIELMHFDHGNCGNCGIHYVSMEMTWCISHHKAEGCSLFFFSFHNFHAVYMEPRQRYASAVSQSSKNCHITGHVSFCWTLGWKIDKCVNCQEIKWSNCKIHQGLVTTGKNCPRNNAMAHP